MNYAWATVDHTNYVELWMVIDEEIHTQEKQSDSEVKQIEKLREEITTKHQGTAEYADLQKRIASAQDQVNKKRDKISTLWEEVYRLEKLNIESYKVDPETEQRLLSAQKAITDKYLNEESPNYIGKNIVTFVEADFKLQEILVVVDPEMILQFTSPNSFTSTIADVQVLAGDIPINVEYVKPTDVACTTRESDCDPLKGGIRIKRDGSTGSGSTLGFKANNPTHGLGFVIAGHETLAVENKIRQPAAGPISGTVKLRFYNPAQDYAFVKCTDTCTAVDNTIWAPEVGSTYPIANRVPSSAQQPGIFLSKSGVGTGVTYGDISVIYPDGQISIKLNSLGGDSGAAVYKPLVNGNADLYGMIIQRITQNLSLYEPWHKIKSDLGLTN